MNYYQKYLKYKGKYLALKNQIGGNIHCKYVECITIPKGTILYRGADNICDINTPEKLKKSVRYCSDTDKLGLYFATKFLISISMCLEYNKLLDFAVFRVNEDIEYVSYGKYSYRNVLLNRINESLEKEGKPILSFENDMTKILATPLLPDENLDHYEQGILPLERITTGELSRFLPEHIIDGVNCLGNAEIFLTDKSIDKLEIVDTFKFNPDKIKNATELFQYIKEQHFPFDIDKYIEDEILIKYKC